MRASSDIEQAAMHRVGIAIIQARACVFDTTECHGRIKYLKSRNASTPQATMARAIRSELKTVAFAMTGWPPWCEAALTNGDYKSLAMPDFRLTALNPCP